MDEPNVFPPPPEDEAADEDDAILAIARLFLGLSPSQLSGGADSEAEPPDSDRDIATDQSDPVFVLDRPVGATRAPREIAPTSRPWRDPWAAAEDDLEERVAELEATINEDGVERATTVQSLLDEYDQSRAAGAEAPESWHYLWWWAEAFGVADELEAEVADRRRTVWIEQPPEEFDGVTREQRLYAGALLNHLPVPPATEPVPQDALPREYVAARDFTLGLGSNLTIPDLDQWLIDHLEQFEYEPVAPPTPARSLRRRRRRFRDDDDESGPVQVTPVKLELDPDPRAGFDSAVDDSDPVTIILGPKPPTFDGHSSRAPYEPPPEPAVPPVRSHKDQLSDLDALEPDMSPPEAVDSAVDDATRGAGRALRIGAIAAAVAAVALVAFLAFSGGDDEFEGDAAVGVGGGGVTATAEATATADPASDATEQPSFTITKPPRLIICGNGTSFSGIEQPDGTFLDEITGERRSCLD